MPSSASRSISYQIFYWQWGQRTATKAVTPIGIEDNQPSLNRSKYGRTFNMELIQVLAPGFDGVILYRYLLPHIKTCLTYLRVDVDQNFYHVGIEYQEFRDIRHQQSIQDAHEAISFIVSAR